MVYDDQSILHFKIHLLKNLETQNLICKVSQPAIYPKTQDKRLPVPENKSYFKCQQAVDLYKSQIRCGKETSTQPN